MKGNVLDMDLARRARNAWGDPAEPAQDPGRAAADDLFCYYCAQLKADDIIPLVKQAESLPYFECIARVVCTFCHADPEQLVKNRRRPISYRQDTAEPAGAVFEFPRAEAQTKK